MQLEGGLSAAGHGDHAPATSPSGSGAGSQQGRGDLLGDTGTDPSRPGGQKKGSAKGSPTAALVALEPEVRDLEVGKGPRPPSPSASAAVSSPRGGGHLVALSQAPW